MRLNLVLFALIAYGCSCMPETPCPKLTSCKCTETGSFRINIDCHDAKLNLSETCRLCESIKHIRYLDVSENGLKEIPPSCFKDCTELEVLSLASNNLSVLTKETFTGLGNLKFLNLDNNSVLQENGQIADPNVFEALNNLKTLRIQKNRKILNITYQTTYLSNVANDTLEQLQSLYLDGVTNAEFGTNFLTFTNLTNISFSGDTANCYMAGLGNCTFQNVPHVEYLSLSHCSILFVDPLAFEPLKKLKILNISYNMALGFSSLRNVSFGLRNSRSIEVLDYSKVYKTFGLTTQLNRCDVWFLQNTSLKEIRLNSNRMASFEINAVALLPPTLEVLYLEDNQLTFGPYALQSGCLTDLRRIELNKQFSIHPMSSYNEELNIKENIKTDSSDGCHVHKSSLKSGCLLNSSEPISWLDFAIPRSLKTVNARSSLVPYEPSILLSPWPLGNILDSLDLSRNVYYKWTDPLLYMGLLKHLNLSRNFCSNVSASFFRNFPNLESLDASLNQLGPDLKKGVNEPVFQELKSLRLLNISNNLIEYLHPKVLIYNRFLENLDISFNQIENISFKFEQMKNLSTLLLRQNKISSLPISLLEQMTNYSKASGKNITIDLSENILDASNCENMEFVSWMSDHPEVFVNINSYRFYIGSHELKPYSDIMNIYKRMQKKCNQKTYGILITVLSAFIMTFISIITGAIVYRYRWRLRYLYYMTKARYNDYVPIRDMEVNKEYQYDVFISYSNDDYQFVTSEMFKKLDEAGLSLCLHQKDFLPGNDIAENIVQAVRNSRKTLIVLSPGFLASKWCIYEFNMARMESIYSRDGINAAMFVIMYEDIDLTKISPEMRDCLESESYLAFPRDEAEEPYFWRMLIQALHRPSSVS